MITEHFISERSALCLLDTTSFCPQNFQFMIVFPFCVRVGQIIHIGTVSGSPFCLSALKVFTLNNNSIQVSTINIISSPVKPEQNNLIKRGKPHPEFQFLLNTSNQRAPHTIIRSHSYSLSIGALREIISLAGVLDQVTRLSR